MASCSAGANMPGLLLLLLGVNAMRNMLTKVAAAAVVLMGVATSADAFVILTIKDITAVGGTATVTCNTSLAINAGNCGVGTGFSVTSSNNVTFAGIVGDFDVISTQGVTNVPGLPTVATANTTSLTVSRIVGSIGTQNLVVDFVAFGFTQPLGEVKYMDGSAALTGNFFTAGDLVNTTFSVDSEGGTGFVAGPTITNTSCLMAAAPSNNCDSPQVLWSDPNSGTPGFSTRTQQVFQMASTSVLDTTSRLKITPIPEPMSISLVGAALLGLGVASRRRRAAAAKA